MRNERLLLLHIFFAFLVIQSILRNAWLLKRWKLTLPPRDWKDLHLNKVDDWSAFSQKGIGQKNFILLTGVAGFIGSHTALLLLQKGYHVIGVDNLSRGSPIIVEKLESLFPASFFMREADLGNSTAVESVLREYHGKIEAVIHLAAVAFVAESVQDPHLYYTNNTDNTRSLVDQMIAHRIHRLVFASSSAVYGSPSQHEQPASEDDAVMPLSPYGHSKLQAEILIQQKAKESDGYLNVVMLRYFNVVGAHSSPRESEGYEYSGFGERPRKNLLQYARLWTSCLAAISGDIPCVNIPLQHTTRDFVHVDDVARANIAALLATDIESFHVGTKNTETDQRKSHSTGDGNRGSRVEIFNVASGTPISIKTFVQTAEKISGVRITTCNMTQKNATHLNLNDRRGNEPSTLYGSYNAFYNRTGWKPNHSSLFQMLSTAWAFYIRENLNGRENLNVISDSLRVPNKVDKYLN